MKSISRFLLISLLISLVSLSIITTLWSYRDATHEVGELFDAELGQMARVLQSLLTAQLKRTQLGQIKDSLEYSPFEPDADQGQEEATPMGHKYEKKLAFLVWNEQGDELLSSRTRGATLQFNPTPGYDLEQLSDHRWRTFMLHDSDLNIWIKVAQRSDVREELHDEIIRDILLPMILMIPILCGVIWIVVRQGLNPIRRLSRQITSRNPDNLSPLDTQGVPSEISDVVEAINNLLSKLDAAFDRERRFTADAAHELRTPLAGIRIHAQNLQQQQTDNSSLAPAQIIEGVDKMTHVVEQLLTLSRLEHQSINSQESVDLSELVRRNIASLMSQALTKSQRLEFETPSQIRLKAAGPALEMLCRNLIDNAIRYTPTNGRILVQLQEQSSSISLIISDDGPGVPEQERPKVLQRFYRLAGQSVSGSGLGLSIAQQVVDLHGATLSLEGSSLGETGLCVRVVIPIVAT